MTLGLAVTETLALDSERGSGSHARGQGKLGPGINGENPPKVITEAPAQSFVVKGSGEFGLFPKLR